MVTLGIKAESKTRVKKNSIIDSNENGRDNKERQIYNGMRNPLPTTAKLVELLAKGYNPKERLYSMQRRRVSIWMVIARQMLCVCYCCEQQMTSICLLIAVRLYALQAVASVEFFLRLGEERVSKLLLEMTPIRQTKTTESLIWRAIDGESDLKAMCTTTNCCCCACSHWRRVRARAGTFSRHTEETSLIH